MWMILKLWLGQNWLVLAKWGGMALTVVLVLLGARNSGKQAVRVDELKKSVEIKNAQLKEAVRRPRDRDELRDRMRADDF